MDNLPPYSKVEIVYNGQTIHVRDAKRGGKLSTSVTFPARAGAIHPTTGQQFGYVYAKVTVGHRPRAPKHLQKHFRNRLYLCTSPVPFQVR